MRQAFETLGRLRLEKKKRRRALQSASTRIYNSNVSQRREIAQTERIWRIASDRWEQRVQRSVEGCFFFLFFRERRRGGKRKKRRDAEFQMIKLKFLERWAESRKARLGREKKKQARRGPNSRNQQVIASVERTSTATTHFRAFVLSLGMAFLCDLISRNAH